MEPPAVSSSTSSNGSTKARSQPSESYLQIDAANSYNRSYDDLPENFLETISPQQSSGPSTMISEHASSPQLAPLAPMSMANEGNTYMIGMSGQYSSHPSLEKTSFGNGPAGLLSPLHLDGRRAMGSSTDFGRHVYIKDKLQEENDLDPHHMLLNPQMSSQQDLDRIDQNETPPAVSNVELASTMIASLIGETRGSSPSPHSYSGPSSSVMQQRVANMKHDVEEPLEGHSHLNGDDHEAEFQRQFIQKARRAYSTRDASDPLNAEIDDDIYIDTKELCKRIAYELKQHSIPQAIFAERILCRSQGTLSDLLRNPKPWNKLKSGRETFRRMFNWVQQPLSTRLGILDLYKQDGEDILSPNASGGAKPPIGMAPPTPAQNVRHGTRRSIGDDGPSAKRPRLVFTDIQKRTLQAIFRETQRPSREMQQTIAEHLRLDLSTVANFFMNARRRSRIGGNIDEPQPYQQVRPVTPPPPDSPPRTANGARRRVPASMQHVEATVSAESALGYGRDAAGHDVNIDDDEFKLYKDPIDGGMQRYDAGIDVVHCESLTPMGDSPVDVVDRGIIKQEEELDDVAAAAQ